MSSSWKGKGVDFKPGGNRNQGFRSDRPSFGSSRGRGNSRGGRGGSGSRGGFGRGGFKSDRPSFGNSRGRGNFRGGSGSRGGFERGGFKSDRPSFGNSRGRGNFRGGSVSRGGFGRGGFKSDRPSFGNSRGRGNFRGGSVSRGSFGRGDYKSDRPAFGNSRGSFRGGRGASGSRGGFGRGDYKSDRPAFGNSRGRGNFRGGRGGSGSRGGFGRGEFNRKGEDGDMKTGDGKRSWNDKRPNAQEEESDFEEVTVDVGNEVKTPAKVEDYNSDVDDETERKDTQKLVQKQNRKNKKSGGFQVMGLSYNMLKGITRRGYKIPTPIQRKTIPLILDGKDVVAMARTGSGKTAAFLIPMFEKLHKHSAQSGARALILSPTRELAVQTLKFTKEIGKFTGLRAAVVLGGDRMDDQFAALHENPDIIIATPGRFMHIVVEMDLKLQSVQYVVFDEADRLFEMGFQEQLTEILNRLPETRQTLLFSATLPKLLVDFAKAGLHDPTLVRLDVETKISQQLKMCFLHCRVVDKLALLIYLLKRVIKKREQTVIFAATKHHVEYIHMILEKVDIRSSYIYSSLDPTARKINIAKFQNGRVRVLVVTDLAARGIDIPLLDNVINFHFPAQPKLFVHRVGRVARAGRYGTAYSLVCQDEVAHMFDLHLFLGRGVKYVPLGKSVEDEDGLYGMVPQSVIDDPSETLLQIHKESYDIEAMVQVCSNAFSNYMRSRPAPAPESIKRVKEMENLGQYAGIHPIFERANDSTTEVERMKILDALKSYKSASTIFEVNATSKTNDFSMMKKKRSYHGNIITRKMKKIEEFQMKTQDVETSKESTTTEAASELDLQNAFSKVIGGKRKERDQSEGDKKLTKKQRREMKSGKDEENYVSYRPADFQSELGLRLGNDFDRDAAGAMLDLAGDDAETRKQKNSTMRWDRKKKKFIQTDSENTKKKKIRTESGAWISASYKSNAYRDWLHKSQHDNTVDNTAEDDDEGKPDNKTQNYDNRLVVLGTSAYKRRTMPAGEGDQNKSRTKFRKPRSELKRPEQILKQRKVKAQKQAMQNKRQKINTKNSAIGKSKAKKSGKK